MPPSDRILGAREITDPAAEIERLAAARAMPAEPGHRGWLGSVHFVVHPSGVTATHLPSGIQGRGVDRDRALEELSVILVARGDISINDARAAMGREPFSEPA